MSNKVRPTKKQQELLGFIEEFIAGHGYSPSYREIMKGAGYNSVATVALHVNSLIKRGHLDKRGRSARSLEVVSPAPDSDGAKTGPVKASDEKWLVDIIDERFSQVEAAKNPAPETIDQLYVLVGALKVIGLDGAVQSFIPRLSKIKSKNP